MSEAVREKNHLTRVQREALFDKHNPLRKKHDDDDDDDDEDDDHDELYDESGSDDDDDGGWSDSESGDSDSVPSAPTSARGRRPSNAPKPTSVPVQPEKPAQNITPTPTSTSTKETTPSKTSVEKKEEPAVHKNQTVTDTRKTESLPAITPPKPSETHQVPPEHTQSTSSVVPSSDPDSAYLESDLWQQLQALKVTMAAKAEQAAADAVIREARAKEQAIKDEEARKIKLEAGLKAEAERKAQIEAGLREAAALREAEAREAREAASQTAVSPRAGERVISPRTKASSGSKMPPGIKSVFEALPLPKPESFGGSSNDDSAIAALRDVIHPKKRKGSFQTNSAGEGDLTASPNEGSNTDPKSRAARARLTFGIRHRKNSEAEPMPLDITGTPLDSPHRQPLTQHRNTEAELAINGAPVTPGADYFYSPADLNLLREMEEKEAMRQALLKENERQKTKDKQKNNIFKTVFSDSKSKSDAATEREMKNHDDEVHAKEERKAVALAKTKNRTEGLLSESTDLDKNERMRNMAINEIVSTERDFVQDLQVINELFYDPLLRRNMVPEQTVATIFSNISVIYDINRALLDQLERTIHLPGGPKISHCFAELISYHKMYSDYCNNHTNAMATVTSLMEKNTTFRKFIEESQNLPRCNGLPFVSFLIKPVQRICKYPLLFKQLIKYEKDEDEIAGLENALQNISLVVNAINETKRAAENMTKILAIKKLLNCKGQELLQPGRYFVKEGHLQELTRNGDIQLIYLCLFNDTIVRAEKKRNKFGTITSRRHEKFNVTDFVPLYSVKIVNVPNSASVTDAFEIQFAKKKNLIVCSSAKEKKEWLETIKDQIININTDNTPDLVNYGEHKSMELRGGSNLAVSPQFGHSRTPSNSGTRSTSSSPSVSREGIASETASPPVANSPLSGTLTKVKCYLNKGTPKQRIRKISLQLANTIQELERIIRREFEWDESARLNLAYEDADGDIVEISSSTSYSDILAEAKCLLISMSESTPTRTDSPSIEVIDLS